MAGFENIRAIAKGNTLNLSYENNLYRNKARGLSEVLDRLSNCGFDTLKVVTLINDLPGIITQLRSEVWKQYKSQEISAYETAQRFNSSYKTDATWKTLRGETPQNPHINKFDLVLYPQFFCMNVRLDRIYEVQLNIAPTLEVSLWRGMNFTGQVILPIVNDVMYGEEGNQVRAGFVTLAQEFRIPGTILVRTVIGKFNEDRYGADLTMTCHFFHDRYYIMANVGYTGEYRYYSKRNWFRDDMNTLTWFLKNGYYNKHYNLMLDFTAGQYLNGDYCIRSDCTRYWGETAVGFFAMVGGGKFNGGFHFAIPIGTKKQKKNRSFQVRAPNYFDWEYNAGTEFYYGQYYETRPNENRAEHLNNANLLIINLLK